MNVTSFDLIIQATVPHGHESQLVYNQQTLLQKLADEFRPIDPSQALYLAGLLHQDQSFHTLLWKRGLVIADAVTSRPVFTEACYRVFREVLALMNNNRNYLTETL